MKTTLLAASSSLALTLLLAACGNKGPLVHAAPPVVPMDAAPAAPVEDTLPVTTPPEQVPATDALETPAQDLNDEAIPPPPPATGGD